MNFPLQFSSITYMMMIVVGIDMVIIITRMCVTICVTVGMCEDDDFQESVLSFHPVVTRSLLFSPHCVLQSSWPMSFQPILMCLLSVSP